MRNTKKRGLLAVLLAFVMVFGVNMAAFGAEDALSGDATLASLEISEGWYYQNFHPHVTYYWVDVDHYVDYIIVTAAANDANATVTGNGIYYLMAIPLTK